MNEKSYCNSERQFLLGWRGPLDDTLETPRCVDSKDIAKPYIPIKRAPNTPHDTEHYLGEE